MEVLAWMIDSWIRYLAEGDEDGFAFAFSVCLYICVTSSRPSSHCLIFLPIYPPLPLLPIKRINDICTIRQKAIPIRIIPHHLLSVPGTRRPRAILHINHIEAFEIRVDQVAPDTLVAVHAAYKKRGG
jgi:hypothetical protein